jgi:hypothetical protein
MRFTDQYFWNFFFLLFFVGCVVFATYVLDRYAYFSPFQLNLFDLLLIALASFRLIRLVVYDKIFAFFREQFWDATNVGEETILTKPKKGPRRTLADLLSCPWCFGIWAAATVTFLYLLTPYAFFPTVFMAIAGVATFLQILANLIGWNAEKAKRDMEG